MTLINYENHYHIIRQVRTLSIDEYLDSYVDFTWTSNACSKCPSYNKNWACPEFENDYMDFYAPYEKIDLIFLRLVFDDYIIKKNFDDDELNEFLHQTLFKQKNILTEELKLLEMDKNGVYLSSGYCNICRVCSKINDEKCLFPNLRRNSVESIGGLVEKITDELFGHRVKWIKKDGRIPEYLSILNAVMY